MSAPVVTLGPRERVRTLVNVLSETDHNGFPVVHPQTEEFLGLVRRDQLVALLEFGVFEEGGLGPVDPSSDPRTSTPSNWTPKPGVGRSPLMHLAYRKLVYRRICSTLQL